MRKARPYNGVQEAEKFNSGNDSTTGEGWLRELKIRGIKRRKSPLKR